MHAILTCALDNRCLPCYLVRFFEPRSNLRAATLTKIPPQPKRCAATTLRRPGGRLTGRGEVGHRRRVSLHLAVPRSCRSWGVLTEPASDAKCVDAGRWIRTPSPARARTRCRGLEGRERLARPGAVITKVDHALASCRVFALGADMASSLPFLNLVAQDALLTRCIPFPVFS